MTGKDGPELRAKAGQSLCPLSSSLVKDSGKHGHPTAWVEFHGRSLSTRLRKPGRELRLKEAFHLVDRDMDGVLISGPKAPRSTRCASLLCTWPRPSPPWSRAAQHVPTCLAMSTSLQGSDTSSELALPRQASFAGKPFLSLDPPISWELKGACSQHVPRGLADLHACASQED